MSDEPSHSATLPDHDDECGDHDASGSTTPSDHDQGVYDPSSSTLPPHPPDDEM